jgi:ubiquinone/menaquinone biosynthesis C-methylase UbiE
MTVENKVSRYYSRRRVAETILAQVRQVAKDPDRLTTDDLAPFDDMHIGGRKATGHLLSRLGLSAGMSVLDIGSGIGGPARYAAENFKVKVTGIDLTPEYREAAEILSAAVGLYGRLVFISGSALSMSFRDGAFDAAYTIHVGMNIQDKAGLYREVGRVLKPGAVFGIYDVMAGRRLKSCNSRCRGRKGRKPASCCRRAKSKSF